LIEIWETFLMQLDADEEDQPFFKPHVMQTEPLAPRTGPGIDTSQNASQSQETNSNNEGEQAHSAQTTRGDAGIHDVAARVAEAAITAEQVA
jgi:hypothetical protein